MIHLRESENPKFLLCCTIPKLVPKALVGPTDIGLKEGFLYFSKFFSHVSPSENSLQ